MHDYAGHTTLNPLGFAILLSLGLAMLLVRRERATIPFILLACFVAPAQRIVVAGLDFSFMRLMVLFGWARVVLRNEHRSLQPHAVDWLIVAWAVVKAILHTIQWGEAGALVTMLGQGFESLGVYFLARVLVRSIDDVKAVIRSLAIVSLPILVFFLYEKATGRNVFSVFGGVPALTMVRAGALRVQGAFAHPIIAGGFWAASLPGVLAMLRKDGKTQPLMAAGVVSILAIVILSASSTPLVGVMLAFVGMAFYPLRSRMRLVQVATLGLLVMLDLGMKAPLWHLLGRMNFIGGSTGYYRYLLIDRAIRYFKDWFLVGMRNTFYWSAGTGEILTDMVNQYILEGVEGGFLTMALFIAVIVACFRCVGKIVESRVLSGDDERLVWSLGAALFAHSLMFLVVSYFGQMIMLWNLHLAMIVSMRMIYLPAGAGAAKRGPIQYCDR